jgi:cysteine desulfuration protein SufE
MKTPYRRFQGPFNFPVTFGHVDTISSSAMTVAIEEIYDDFAFLDEWEDRYRYIIELGQGLPEFPETAKTNASKVQGCVSQVWVTVDRGPGADPVVIFAGDSDAHIVKGLVAIMLALFSGRRASEIVAIDAEETMRRLGLDEHLSRQRANGLRSLVNRIKREGAMALEAAA